MWAYRLVASGDRHPTASWVRPLAEPPVTGRGAACMGCKGTSAGSEIAVRSLASVRRA